MDRGPRAWVGVLTISEIFELPPGSPLLEQALTHPSYANENKGALDNQRLEFLGDAVLSLCTSELLCARFPDADEGALTRMRAQLVNAEALAAWARENGVPEVLRLGRGASAAGLAPTTNVTADAVEVLIAAGFLAGGLAVSRRVCARIVDAQLMALSQPGERDPKSQIQEELQALKYPAPTYLLIGSEGPAHERWFEVCLVVEGHELGRGRGRSKREAERSAAVMALGVKPWQNLPPLPSGAEVVPHVGVADAGEAHREGAESK